MAAEVPVKDVLCEAMEYLSKLGSNLRTRTENLKEKKIRKDRLNNAIAVQKAANKVLLICELSKKSLENVETGVRKILQRVDVSQAPLDGGNSSKTKITSNNLEKPYLFSFVYKSKKLKIRKKVNLKHFMSVKVMAKKMPISMLKKYPIYYDCKLYRLKKKWEQKKSEKKSNDKDSEKSTDKNEDSSPIIDSEVSASHSAKNKSDDEKDDKHVSDDEKVNKHRPRDRTKSRSSSHKSGNTPTKDGKKQEEESSKISKYRSSKDSDVKDDEFVETSRKKLVVDSDDSTDKKDESSKRTKKRFKSAVIDSSEDEENKEDSQKIKSQKNDDTSKGTLNDFSMDYDESPKVVDNNVNIDTSIPSPQPPSPVETTQPEKNSIDDESKNDSIQEPEAKKRKTSSCDKPTDTDVNNDVVTLDSSDDEPTNDKDRAKTPENNGNEIKPMIKLVSLSKLLKPNIKPKDVLGHSPKVKDNKKYEFDKNEKKARKLLEEEAYWAKKRIEVKAFKSKKFTVNVARLPKLSSKFLQKHKLKKITQNGKTVHEIEDEKEKSLERNGSNSDNEIQAETDKVKNALLNDSDSDAFEDNYSSRHKYKNNVETKTAKDLLLNDSDSNSSQRKTAKENEKAKRKMILATDSEKSDNENDTKKNSDKIAKDNEKAKRKMILGTDSEKSDNENNTKKNSDKENETQNVNDNENDTQNKSDNENETQNKSDKENDTKNKSDKENDTKNKSDKENDTKNKSDKENDTQNKSDNENDTKNKSDIENDTQNKSDNENNTQNKSDNENDTQSNSHKENGSRNNSDNEQNDETGNKSDSSKDQDGQITPKKSLTPIEEENAKELLLNNSSDDKTNTPLKQRKNSKPETPQSKKKNIRESIRAKKMLLTYSSSSETDDEQLRKVLRNIKDDLLKEISDEDETKNTKRKDSDAKSDESTENLLEQVKKKMTHSSDSEASRKISRQQDSKKKRKMVRSKSKPGNCSSQNSDTVDSNDKEIDGLTNLNNLTKTRRRNADDQNDSETQGSTQSNSRSRNRASSTVVTTGLLGEEMLKAESDSDDATGDENEVVEDGDDEVMPSVSFNGVGIQHLAKDDLLGESDSSTSQNEKTSETNKEDSDEEEKLNSKRRKANAISSDSEAGSSRKKDKDIRVSDFEDSEDESSEPMKRSKRKKKKGSESDGSAASSNEGGKKKRRRIKQMDSDASGSETENEGRNKHGRKNIRKVMGKNQLEEATKKAAREERERCARIAERQKLYNNLEFDETGKPDEVVLEKVVLDFDSETKEPLIEVDRGLVKKLKPHQANGIKFMWNACFESVKRIKKDKGSGCILAHCMGLGKTLQVVTLTHTLLTHSDLTKVNRVLVVCPLSTVLNWVNEFKMWLKYAEVDYEVDVYELSRFKQNSERAFQLSQWFDHGGVCVLGYEMFRNLSADNNKKFKKKMLKNFQEALVDPGPDLVVCDEGHLLKNEKTSLSQSMNRVKTLRRIVLTGTPLQNNLKEYYCMVQFVKPNLLGKYNEYLNRFVNPITNGQYTDSTEHDIKIMKRRSHVLHKMLDGSVQRRDYGVLAPFLPPKHEYVLFITLTEVQIKLYQFYLENYSRRPLAGKSSGFLFPDFQSLQRIWTHPLVLKYNSERYEIMQQKKREREEEDSEGSLVDFIDDDSTPEESSEEEMTDDLSDLSDDSGKKSKKKKNAKKNKGKESKASAAAATRRGTRANPREQEEEEEVDDVMEVKNDNPTEWWIKMVTDDEIDDMRNSHKLILLFDILRQCEAIGDKLLVFSQSLYSLDLIEHFLGKVDEATQEGRVDEKLGGHVGSWSPGVDYFRLDGSTSCENRSIWCKNFNREDNPRARLFLISTRAGGLGINLVAANRVVIFDVSWNPSHDVQSIFRVYRFGQKKPCYVYRFLAMGTMEEKIYERQVTKQAISKRVIDEQQIDRHYAENDLAELYKFEPQPPQPRPIPPLPKDRLFAEMLKEHEAQIYKYHEHDSLLENKEEETLSEEERKAAWEDFENEKNRPPPAPFVSPWPMHNGMVPGLLAQQQQQLAYAALAAMIRKDMPNVNDNQIRDMLPLIYNANPGMFGGYDYGLMQKMNEVYKYAQPGMMNPMMTAMNSASGGGAMSGMGGTSGLQYEPPWQRQQQMRLQQLMQQQNQMGAKFYAGGLGSRDPVAMALQQQRAREIMLSGGTAGGGAGAGAGAGRPRGRPPMQPRLPPAATGDVVNLDSD